MTQVDKDLFRLKCSSATNDNANHFLDDELVHGRRLCLSIEQELSSIDDQIARLKAKREPHATSLANLKIALAPHRRLPSELLMRIFILALVGETVTIQSDKALPSRLPWILGQVCSRWRDIVSAEPQLWKEVELISSIWEAGRGYVERTDQFLPQGILSWKLYDNSNPFCLELQNLPFSSLLHLTFELPLPNLVKALTVIPPSFALLERIKLITWDKQDRYEESSFTDLIYGIRSTNLFKIAQDVVSLTFEVRFDKEGAEAFLQIPCIPWRKLVYFCHHAMISDATHLDRFVNALEECASLEGLAYSISNRRTPIHHTLDSVSPPQLTRLEVIGDDASQITFPWAQITQLSFHAAQLPFAMDVISQTRGLETLEIIGENLLSSNSWRQPYSNVNESEQVEPEVDEPQPASEDNVDEFKPESDVDESKPNSDVDEPEPDSNVDDSEKAKSDVDEPESESEIDESEPESDIDESEPESDIDESKPNSDVDESEADSDADESETASESEFESDADESSPPVILDSLTSLSISEYYDGVFHLIHPPQLQSFLIVQSYKYHFFWLAPILKFIQRWDLNLTSFHHDAYFPGDWNADRLATLHKFLYASTSLRQLHARRLPMNDALLLQMGKGLLLPKIEELEIEVKPTMSFADAIQMRCETARRDGSILLRLAHGHYPVSCVNNGGAINIASTIGRFTKLNASHGTDFKMVATVEKEY